MKSFLLAATLLLGTAYSATAQDTDVDLLKNRIVVLEETLERRAVNQEALEQALARTEAALNDCRSGQ